MAVTLQDVQKAVQEIRDKNGRLSVREVRKVLGTGSMATISGFLREINELKHEGLNDSEFVNKSTHEKGLGDFNAFSVVEKVLKLSEALQDSTQDQLDQALAFHKAQLTQEELLREALVKADTYENLVEELNKTLKRTEGHYLTLNERMANLLRSTQCYAEDVKKMYEEKLKVVEQRESLLIAQVNKLTAENSRLQLKIQNLNAFPTDDADAA